MAPKTHTVVTTSGTRQTSRSGELVAKKVPPDRMNWLENRDFAAWLGKYSKSWRHPKMAGDLAGRDAYQGVELPEELSGAGVLAGKAPTGNESLDLVQVKAGGDALGQVVFQR